MLIVHICSYSTYSWNLGVNVKCSFHIVKGLDVDGEPARALRPLTCRSAA